MYPHPHLRKPMAIKRREYPSPIEVISWLVSLAIIFIIFYSIACP